jgi:UDP:flavonoid glycosyltransferase YjiC (YdhE family)
LSEQAQAFLDDGPPPIAFTPGTANRESGRFFQTAVDVCQMLGRRGVLLTKFPEQLPTALPPTMVALSFEPLRTLLPRCAAFVHHGGIGSSSQGLAAGVPQLVRPLAFDQPDNAARLERLGVAEVLGPRAFTTQRASAALERLLTDMAVAERCTELAARCDGGAARRAACDVLESLLAGQQSIARATDLKP